ncbi:MAG: hypothetical protein MJK14_20825 [Rivularia sp. ALOHA_DT_140]|nr:hypothetical protein [Rivularia sp. ALOHA_DT_140]
MAIAVFSSKFTKSRCSPLLDNLRKLRNQHGIEAVIIVKVIGFDTEKSTDSGFILTKNTKTKTFDIRLNLQVLDTTTGKIIREFQGHGDESRNTETEVKIGFSAIIDGNIYRQYDEYEQRWKTTSSSNSSIKFTLGGDATNTTTIHKKENTVAEKLLVLATDEALDDVVGQLKFNWEEVACKLRKPTLISRVYKKDGEVKVILNKGKSHGYCEDMTFSIEKFPDSNSEEVIDPATGEVLIGSVGEEIGKVTLKKVEPGYSVGTFIPNDSGKSIQVKDVAKFSTIPDSCLKKPTNISRSAKDLKLQKMSQNMFFFSS